LAQPSIISVIPSASQPAAAVSVAASGRATCCAGLSSLQPFIDDLEGSAVGAQLIRDHPFRREALLAHQLAHQLDGSAPVSPALNQDVEDLAL